MKEIYYRVRYEILYQIQSYRSAINHPTHSLKNATLTILTLLLLVVELYALKEIKDSKTYNYLDSVIAYNGSEQIGTGGSFTPSYVLATGGGVMPSLELAINVASYGAVGDGVTDDTTAIQNAANAAAAAGQPLVIPYTEQFYKISAAITINSSVIGIGGMPTITQTNNATNSQGSILILSNNMTGWIYNLHLLGQYDGTYYNYREGVYPPGEWAHAINLDGVNGVTIKGNLIESPMGDGLSDGRTSSTRQARNVLIDNNTFLNALRCEISATTNSDSWAIMNNRIIYASSYVNAVDLEPNGEEDTITNFEFGYNEYQVTSQYEPNKLSGSHDPTPGGNIWFHDNYGSWVHNNFVREYGYQGGVSTWTNVNTSNNNETVGSPTPTPTPSDTTYEDLIKSETSLVAYFRLGELSGSIASDSAATTNNGSYLNSPTLGITGAITGDSNTAVTFTSSESEGVQVPHNSAYNFGTGDYSIEFWVNFASWPGSGQFLVSHGGNNSNGEWESRTSGSEGSFSSRINDINVASSSDSDFIEEGWHHMVLVMDRDGDGQWYKDGEEYGFGTDISSNASDIMDFNAPFYIGRRTAAGYLNGSVDEVAVYNVALTLSQIQDHYNTAYNPPVTPTPSPTNEPTPTPTDEPTPTPTEIPSLTPTLTVSTVTPTPTITVINQGGISNSGSSNSSSCNVEKPSSAPNLFQIDTTLNTASLYFSPAGKPYDRYFVQYGLTPSANQFGAEFGISNVDGVIKFIIGDLEQDKTYYFTVLPGNKCAPGDWSKVISAKTGKKQTVASSFLDKINPVNIINKNFRATTVSVPVKPITPTPTLVNPAISQAPESSTSVAPTSIPTPTKRFVPTVAPVQAVAPKPLKEGIISKIINFFSSFFER